MYRLKSAFKYMAFASILVVLVSWMTDDGLHQNGPLPKAPSYDDPTQWFIRDRGACADIFYVISTETGDHMIGSDTCHYADTYDDYLRGRMEHEMIAVDSFYSGPLNYFSPYYRQVSMESWETEETAMSRIPLALHDVSRSWDYYISHLNQGRPFILAGFSQGAHAIMDIMTHMPDSISQRLIATYVIGYRVTQEDLDNCPIIRPAQGADDTGVTICFNSVRSPESAITVVSGDNQLCINPVNWRTDTVSTPFILYGKRGNDTLTVHCDPDSRLLIVDGYKNPYVMPVIGKPGNYHHMELKFYYPYIRQNMSDRVWTYMLYRKSE